MNDLLPTNTAYLSAASMPALAPAVQVSAAQASDVLAALAQAGILAVIGRSYCIAPELYQDAEVTPQALAPENAILAYVEANGRITRGDVMALCDVSERQATYLLQKLTQQGQLSRQGSRRGAEYSFPGVNRLPELAGNEQS